IAELEDPSGTITTDTLSYRMAKPDGRWLGKGLLSKESKLWYKEAISLPYVGNYTVRVRSAMRYNENVSPIEVLPGIKAVGIGIEK
ncbi:MAG: gliding motility lipoprotein GldH, partial [Flavobacteriaceae bacterium]